MAALPEGGVMAFLGLSRFPRALHLPGELL